MEKKTITINRQVLQEAIKEAIDGMLNTNTDNTLGGNPHIDQVIEVIENWEFKVDQISGNEIYAHLENDDDLGVVVEVTNIGAKVKEVHYTGGDFDTSYCTDLEYLTNKLAEVWFDD